MGRFWLGAFGTPEEAAMIYDQAAVKIRGPKVRTNFRVVDDTPFRLENELDEEVERSRWLSGDWRVVASSGAIARLYDRCYISPTGEKFYSKYEVLHFLETGCKVTVNMKINSDETPQESEFDEKRTEAMKISKLEVQRNDSVEKKFIGAKLGTFEIAEEAATICYQVAMKIHEPGALKLAAVGLESDAVIWNHFPLV